MERSREISSRLKELKNDIGKSTLIAVSKYHTIEDIGYALAAGQLDFGESKVQDLLVKAEHFKSQGNSDINWHFIGRLQSNKINMLAKVPSLKYIHSIDSLKLLEALLKREENFELSRNVGIFLQLNTSGEEEKGGFRNVDDLLEAVSLLQEHNSKVFYLEGLMTIGRIRTNNFEDDARYSFNELRELRDNLNINGLKLSMGMSQDYKLALEYGSSYVRIGSAIFG